MEITRAILLRRTRLTESSLILSWLTASCGRIQTVAKGARSPKSPFSGRVDLFFDCEIRFTRSKKTELHRLCEVSLCNPHEGLRRHLANLQLATHFVRLLEAATEPGAPCPELHDLLQRAVGHLTTHAASQKALFHFERQLALLLGILQPEIQPWICLSRILTAAVEDRKTLVATLPPAPFLLAEPPPAGA